MKTLVALIFAAAVLPASAATHTVVKGDHLWGLAGHYYGNNFRWKVIYAANQDKIADPHWIYPGQVFVIPDVPGPEIGELPARPVENEPEAAAVEPEVVAAAPVKPVEDPLPPPVRTDDLSVDMPQGFAGQYPSMARLMVEKDWKHDGQITEFEGRETMAAEGDWIHGELASAASEGDRFWVYRPTSAQELDADPKGRYFQRMGIVELNRVLGKGSYRFLILKSGDSVQVGDLLKLERK